MTSASIPCLAKMPASLAIHGIVWLKLGATKVAVTLRCAAASPLESASAATIVATLLPSWLDLEHNTLITLYRHARVRCDLACIIHRPRKNHDNVSHDIDGGRAWRSEGINANSCNAIYGARYGAGIFPSGPLQKLGLRAATWHRPIAFAPEGLPLDH